MKKTIIKLGAFGMAALLSIGVLAGCGAVENTSPESMQNTQENTQKDTEAAVEAE